MFYVLVALVSLAVGSFLNVVIYRLPLMLKREWYHSCIEFLQENIDDHPEVESAVNTLGQHENAQRSLNLLFPSSACPHCGHRLAIWENIPLVSFLLLRGRCRGCQKKISFRYPVVEFITVVFSLLTAHHFGPTLMTLCALTFLWSLIVLVMIDLDFQLLPDDVTLSLLWLGLLISIWHVFISPVQAIVGVLVGYLVLWSFFHLFKLVTGKEGMGYGDFKLFAAIGAWVGWSLLPMVILFSAIVGSIVGVFLLLRGHESQVPIPFGPYLASAGWVVLLYGAEINQFYWSLF